MCVCNVPILLLKQVRDIETFAGNNHVEVKVDPRSEIIELVGLATNVSTVNVKVMEILRYVPHFKK